MFCLLPLGRRVFRPLQQPQAFRNLSTTFRKLGRKKNDAIEPLTEPIKRGRKRKETLEGDSNQDDVQKIATKTSKKLAALQSPDPTLPSGSTKRKIKKDETLESPKLSSEICSTKKDVSEKTDPDISNLPIKKPRKRKETSITEKDALPIKKTRKTKVTSDTEADVLPTKKPRKKKDTSSTEKGVSENAESDILNGPIKIPRKRKTASSTENDISEKPDPDIPDVPVKKPRKRREKLVYPDSISQHHSDLPSFLEHATRKGMDQTSTTYVGTHYEYIVQIAFEERLKMTLKRIGGRSDYGIDLLGTWKLPSEKRPFRVLIQCKAFVAKVQPAVVRELEGAFVGAPPGWRDPDVLGFLVSQKAATKGVREAIGRSRWPMGYILCESDGSVLQIIWNRRASQVALEGMEVQTRYLGGRQTRREALLSWKGKPI